MSNPCTRYVLIAAAMLTFVIYMLSNTLALPKITAFRQLFPWHNESISDRREHTCTNCATENNKSPNFSDVFGTYTFPQPKCDGKLLVYECTTWLCGGLADREKGIMSSFLLSLLTDRTFVIEHRKPCELKQFLEPTLYDWSKFLSQVAAARSKGNHFINCIDGWNSKALPQNFSKLKSGDLWPQQVVTIKINIDIHARIKGHPDIPSKLPWLKSSPPVKVITGLMHALFKPVSKLETHLKQFINNQTENGLRQFVGVHIRNDFLHNKDDVKFVFEFLKLHFSDKKKYCLYIATDKMDIRNKARAMFDNFASIDGQIMNVDWPVGKDVCGAMYIAVFEQLVLSRADILVLTRSGFSQYAAYFRGTSESIHFMTMSNSTNRIIFEQIELSKLSDKATELVHRQMKLKQLNKGNKQ